MPAGERFSLVKIKMETGFFIPARVLIEMNDPVDFLIGGSVKMDPVRRPEGIPDPVVGIDVDDIFQVFLSVCVKGLDP